MTWQTDAVSLVFSATEGKYEGRCPATAERQMAQLSPLFDTSSADELRDLLAPPITPEQDTANQLVVLALIEKHWSRDGHPGVGISELHRALFGVEGVDVLREADHIPDFGGLARTPWQEVTCRIDELERASRELGDGMESASLPAKARFLAHVFASIIRIHPFPDGNGRTARMYVQYLLRRWGHPYMIIPKVRNDSAWAEALSEAIAGEIRALQSQFERRMMDSQDAV